MSIEFQYVCRPEGTAKLGTSGDLLNKQSRQAYVFIVSSERTCVYVAIFVSGVSNNARLSIKGVAVEGKIVLKLNGTDTQLVTTPCLLMSHLYLTHSDPARFREQTSETTKPRL